MARKTVEVKARITAEDRASKKVKKAEGSFRRLGKYLSSGFVISIAAVTAAFVGMAKGFASVIRAAEQQEEAVNSLDAALSSLGDRAGGVSKGLQEYAAALQQVTRYGDETIIKGQALLASFTKNSDEIEKATAAALDLSAAVGTDLNASFLLLAKAAAGETSMLSRYGIILDESVPKSEKFAAALAKINEQFGGRAAADAKTFSGLVDQISNAFGDLKEKVGESITKNQIVLDQLTALKDMLTSQGAIDAVTELAAGFSSLTADALALGHGLADAKEKMQPLIDLMLLPSPGALLLQKVMKDLVETGRKLQQEAEETAKALKFQAEVMEILTRETRDLHAEEEKIAELIRANLKTWNTMRKMLGSAAEATDILTESEKRLLRIQTALAKGADEFADGLSRIGTRLSAEVNAEIEKNNALLEEAERRFYLGAQAGDKLAVTFEDLAKIQRDVAAANAELRGGLAGVTIEAGATDTAAAGLGVSLDGAAVSADKVATSLERVKRTLVETERLTVSAARRFDELAASAGRAAAVQDAMAGGNARISGNRIFFGNQGGSRFIDSPSSFSSIGGGTFTNVKPVRALPNGRLE